MDRSNLNQYQTNGPDSRMIINKGRFAIENEEVPDPYYGNEDGFKKVFDLIDQACDQLSEQLQKMQS